MESRVDKLSIKNITAKPDHQQWIGSVILWCKYGSVGQDSHANVYFFYFSLCF